MSSDEFDSFETRNLGDVKAALTSAPSGAEIVTASSLTEIEEDDGDFEPGAYKGFPLAPAPATVPASHSIWPQRFYVLSPAGSVGLVPWPGSKIVWPWERSWIVDMHRPDVQTLLRPEKKK